MKKHLFTISILSVLLLATGCKQTEEKVRHIPTAPQMKARIDRSEPVKTVDVEQAAENPVPLKLSQIASKIEYRRRRPVHRHPGYRVAGQWCFYHLQ